MLFKIVIFVVMALILFNLARGLYQLFNQKDDASKLAKSLTWRVSLAVLLILLLVVGYLQGWIKPHPIGGHAPSAIEAE